jgi:predicted phosphodiesterase
MRISKTEYNKLKRLEGVIDQTGLTTKKLQDLMKFKYADEIKINKKYLKFDCCTFGVIGDTHLNSNDEKLNELHTFYKILEERNIKYVFHAGDLISGQGIYTGQENDIKNIGVDNQVEYFIKYYPKIKGIETWFITGNHDLCYFKTAGLDIGKIVDEKRDDMFYLGQYEADVIVDDNITLKLLHPNGGGGMTISVNGEKMVRNMPINDRPNILAIGHYHTSASFFYHGVNVLMTGCFEGRTTLFKRSGKHPVIGGYIVTVGTNKDSINPVSVATEFITF